MGNTISSLMGVTDLTESDVMPLVQEGETRKATVEQMVDYFGGSIGGTSGGLLPLVDLGTSYSAELQADIQAGTFEKAVVGGYLTINSHKYYFAHPDYWLHTGSTECTTHHMLVIPEGALTTGMMNKTAITTGAYIGSDLYTGNNSNTALASVKSIIYNDFGESNVLSHKGYFANTTSNGYESSGSTYDSKVDLPSEIMIYGSNIHHNIINGTSQPFNYTYDKTQIMLFAERPDLITIRQNWWLRDVVSSGYFAYVSSNGSATCYNANDAYGIRPVFAIC